MLGKPFAIAVLCGACGQVGGGTADAPAAPISYHGTLAATSPVMFGGGPPPKCTYTATLKQLDVTLGILASGQVMTGQVQDLYVEGVVTQCEFTPADPSITNFTFRSATPGTGGMTLAFDEKAGDKPGAALVIALTTAGASYQAQMTFHRTDLGPPFDWIVNATVPLAAR